MRYQKKMQEVREGADDIHRRAVLSDILTQTILL